MRAKAEGAATTVARHWSELLLPGGSCLEAAEGWRQPRTPNECRHRLAVAGEEKARGGAQKAI